MPQIGDDSLREPVLRIKALGKDIRAAEKRLGLQLEQDPHMQRITAIPGVGPLAATVGIVAMGESRDGNFAPRQANLADRLEKPAFSYSRSLLIFFEMGYQNT